MYSELNAIWIIYGSQKLCWWKNNSQCLHPKFTDYADKNSLKNIPTVPEVRYHVVHVTGGYAEHEFWEQFYQAKVSFPHGTL